MKGIELAENFYRDCGAPMLEEQFPDCVGKIAVGLCGSGSECFGFDDTVSCDHDFEPGFCLFLPDEETVDRKTAFRLERAYASLPKEYGGFRRSVLSPVGGNRHGVIRLADFFAEKVGCPQGVLSTEAWLTIPQNYLAEATNGKLFRDDAGTMTAIRTSLSTMPEDVRKKRLAGQLLLAAQAGQYNYPRCMAHGENGAAQLALVRFVESTAEAAFLLSKVYMPYYKWCFRALRENTPFADLEDSFEFLLTGDNIGAMAETKQEILESVAMRLIQSLMDAGLTKAVCGDLEKHAYSVNDGIEDADLRNRHILSAV